MEPLQESLRTYKLPLALSLLGVVLIIGGIFSSGFLSKPKTYPKASLVNGANTTTNQIKIDVSGAVSNPGVYTLSSDSRVEDAIKAAGGFSSFVSNEFIAKSLNLSQKLSDSMKIYIPFEGDSVAINQGAGLSGGGIGSNKIGLNTGTQTELESLPSVGSVTASKIISARPYSDISELKTRKTVSVAVFSKIKDLVDLH